MTRQPTPNLPKPWVLQYIPPKHLRLPGYVYRSVEDTDEGELLAHRGRRKLLERQFKEMAKSLSSTSLSSLSIADDEDQILLDVSREGDLESACVSHQSVRPEMLRVCSISALCADKGQIHGVFNVSPTDTNVL